MDHLNREEQHQCRKDHGLALATAQQMAVDKAHQDEGGNAQSSDDDEWGQKISGLRKSGRLQSKQENRRKGALPAEITRTDGLKSGR